MLVGFVQDVTDQKATNDELARLALVDELTGLRNRRGLLTVAEMLLRSARRDRHNVVLLYIDLDDMKTINDRYGHHVGDQALSEVAALLLSTFRDSDVVARLGGDEFCVLLRANDDRGPITRLKDQLRQRTNTTPPISLSIGAAVSRWEDQCSIEQLLERADAVMYEEKTRKGGRRSNPDPA